VQRGAEVPRHLDERIASDLAHIGSPGFGVVIDVPASHRPDGADPVAGRAGTGDQQTFRVAAGGREPIDVGDEGRDLQRRIRDEHQDVAHRHRRCTEPLVLARVGDPCVSLF